jgi:hypothetical protein
MAGFGDIGADVGGVFGSLIGQLWAEGDEKKRRELLEEIEGLYGEIPVELLPKEEQVVDMGPTAFEEVSEDPALREQQLASMQAFREMYEAGGLDAGARADLAEAQAATAQQERAQRGAILNEAQARGAGNGNATLLAQFAAQQGSAQRAGMEGMRAAGDAQQRAFQALHAAGSLAGDVRGQDYGVSSDKARARDLVAERNSRNRQDVYGRNVDRDFQAQQGTIDNRFRRAHGQAGAKGSQADMYGDNAQRKRNIGYNAGRVGGGVAGQLVTGMPAGQGVQLAPAALLDYDQNDPRRMR